MDIPIPLEITYTDGQRQFRTLFDRCDGCGERFTEKTLKLVADEFENATAVDNIVFSFRACISGSSEAIFYVGQFIRCLTT